MMLYIHDVKTVHFWLKYNGLGIVRRTTKLIEGGHRRLQDYRHYMLLLLRFYRAMHFSAKRGIAIACRLSVRPSVCDVGEL